MDWIDLIGRRSRLEGRAVVVVTQAVWGMSKTLCPDRLRAYVVAAALLVAAVPTAMGQIEAIVSGGLIGRRALHLGHLPPVQQRDYGVLRSTGTRLLVLLGALPVVLPAAAGAGSSIAL